MGEVRPRLSHPVGRLHVWYLSENVKGPLPEKFLGYFDYIRLRARPLLHSAKACIPPLLVRRVSQAARFQPYNLYGSMLLAGRSTT